MPSLNYAAPATVDEAVKLLAGASGLAKVLSGGTDLLVQLRSGRVRPDLIVDTKKIPGIMSIREEAGGFVIGAATPGAVVEAHPGLNKAWPGVVEALDLIGSTQIQGRARSPATCATPRLPRTACRRCMPRPPSPWSSAPTAGAKCRWSKSPPARAARRWPRASSSWSSSCRHGRRAPPTPICASFRARKWISPWSAAASA